MKYRKKPVVIEARVFNGGNHLEIVGWMLDVAYQKRKPAAINHYVNPTEDRTLSITTFEGTMVASPGDYIIRGVKDEFYPCKPDIFEATYEKVE